MKKTTKVKKSIGKKMKKAKKVIGKSIKETGKALVLLPFGFLAWDYYSNRDVRATA